MSGLNDWQARRVLSVLTHIDGLLRSMERLARGEDRSPFDRERLDLSADETDLLLSRISLLRSHMQDALARLGVSIPPQNRSARWSVQTALNVARMELLGLDAAALEGYGPVDPDAGALLEELATELVRIVEQVSDELSGSDG